jgi:integrase
MQRDETTSTLQTANTNGNHVTSFAQARDSRNRKIPGLWIRNGRYYAALWVDRGDGKKTARRFPLEATNISEAKEQMDIKRNDRRENKLPTSGRKPLLSEYIEKYLASPIRQKRRANTQDKDRAALGRWLAQVGNVQVHKITQAHIIGFQEKRLADGVSPRTVNLDLISLRGLLKRATAEGHLRELPPLRELERGVVPKRRLITPEQFQALLEASKAHCPRNGQQFTDYLRFLAFSGAREQEVLRMKWSDVDLTARRIVIGTDGLTKNGEARTVELNSQIEGLLAEMQSRRAPDSVWLFPSPQRGKVDKRTMTFRNSLRLVRVKAGLPWFAFHDLRHYFASMCVMNGLDFMTIAAWLGHKDGGILVGKVYGHLLTEHRHQSAKRLQFGIVAMPSKGNEIVALSA